MKWRKQCENVEKQTLSVPTTLTLFTPEQIQNNITCLRFPQISIFPTKANVSGVIFMYTWDILFGTPCILRNRKVSVANDHGKGSEVS